MNNFQEKKRHLPITEIVRFDFFIYRFGIKLFKYLISKNTCMSYLSISNYHI